MKLNQIYRTVKLPIEIRPEEVKAILKNGVLEVTLPKAEVVKKVHVEVKPLGRTDRRTPAPIGGRAHERAPFSPPFLQPLPLFLTFGYVLRALARDLSLGQSPPYNRLMANPNPLAGVVPQVVHPVNEGETAISEYVEKVEGEVALDSYVKAQTSAPEVVKRITELENCLQRLASAVLTSSDANKNPALRAAAQQAKLLLKNRLEVDESKHRFHSELGVLKDELRILKD